MASKARFEDDEAGDEKHDLPLTDAQKKALCSLSYTWPLPEGYLELRHGIHRSVLLSLVSRGLARYAILAAAAGPMDEYGLFIELTLVGANLRELELSEIARANPSEGWRARVLRGVGREQ